MIPPPRELFADRIYGFERGEVHLDVGLDIEHEPADGARLLVYGCERTVPEVCGVGEEQRRVVAVHHQPGNRPGARVVIHVMHAGQAGNEAEYRGVRPGHADQQVGH